MVAVTTTTERRNDITLVAVRLTNDRSTTQRVELRSSIEPVWPPRRNGVVVPEWDGPVWCGRLEPETSRGIGFASPEPPTDEPIERLESRRAERTSEQDVRSVLAAEDATPTGDSP